MSDITKALVDGRGLLAHDDPDSGESVDGWPQVAIDALSAINEITSHGDSVPAPALQDVLAKLTWITMLGESCVQFADGLRASVQDSAVSDEQGGPSENVELVVRFLVEACQELYYVGYLFSQAQDVLNGGSVSDSSQDPEYWMVEIGCDPDEAISVMNDAIDADARIHGSSFTSGFFDALEWCARRAGRDADAVANEAHQGFTALHHEGDGVVSDKASFTAGFTLGVGWYDTTHPDETSAQGEGVGDE